MSWVEIQGILFNTADIKRIYPPEYTTNYGSAKWVIKYRVKDNHQLKRWSFPNEEEAILAFNNIKECLVRRPYKFLE